MQKIPLTITKLTKILMKNLARKNLSPDLESPLKTALEKVIDGLVFYWNHGKNINFVQKSIILQQNGL